MATATAAAFLLLLLALAEAGNSNIAKNVTITNNHTNYLSLRCFSFDDSFNVVHLAPWDKYFVRVVRRVMYPSTTMFNCSTNMGTFVAYRYDYDCADDSYDKCEWRFDQDSAYLLNPKNSTWQLHDYAPNYESLDRGGVIKGYYAN